MSRHKTQPPKANKHTEDKHNEGKTESTNRHVYVEPGVQIDLVKDFREEYRANQNTNTIHNNRQLFWTVVSAFLIFIYAGLTAWMGWSTKKAADTADKNFTFTQSDFRMEQRPYLSPVPRPAFAKPAANGVDIGKPFAFLMERDHDTFSVAVDLRNIGKSPANNAVFTSMKYIFGQRDKARQEAKRYQPSFESVPNVVAPGEFITPVTPTLPVRKEQAEWFLKGEWELYIVGAVRYTDIFAPPLDSHETTYCFKVRSSGMYYRNCEWQAPDFTSSIK